MIFRVPTPLFGAGLIEQIQDLTIAANVVTQSALAAKSGLGIKGKVNIVVSDDVKGTVTIKMKGVPWDQALDTIVRAKGYRTERDGSVILVLR